MIFFNVMIYISPKFYLVAFAGIINYRRASEITKSIFITLPFLAILCWFVILSTLQGNDTKYALLESRDILMSAITLAIMIGVSQDREASKAMIQCVVGVAALFALFKVLFIIYCAVTGSNAYFLIKQFSTAAGISLQSYQTGIPYIARLQVPYDCVLPFALFYSVSNILNNGVKIRGVLTITFLIISLLLTMARAFWAIGLVMIISALFINSSPKRFFAFVFGATLFCTIVYSFSSDIINETFSARFDSSRNSSSDIERIIQNDGLIEVFEQNQLVGRGIGYFIPDLKRSTGDDSYAYESQSLALLMKLGLIGWAALLFLVIFTCFYYDIKDNGFSLRKIMIKILFIAAWFITGSVNPLLFSTQGALMLYMCSRSNVMVRN